MSGTGKRLICIALLGALLLGCLCSCGFTYAEGDLTQYVEVALSDPAALQVTLPAGWAVTEEEVEETIHTLLLGEKTAVADAAQETNKRTGDGDVVAFYYCGVTEDGQLFTDGFAVGDGTPYLVELGAGTFPLTEVEAALYDIRPGDYGMTSEGTVPADATVYLEYYYEETAGETSRGTYYYPGMRRVCLTDPDGELGTGFTEALVGREVGRYVTFSLTDDFTGEGIISTRTYHVRVRYISEGELVVHAVYPTDAADEERAGKAVTLYLQPMYMVDYDVPALTAETVTEVFGLFTDEEDPVAAFRARVRELLEEDEERMETFRLAAWEALMPLVTVKKLPRKQVKKLVSALKRELKELYEYSLENLYDACVGEYGEEAMASLDGFARVMYESEAGESVDEILTREAESEVTRDLVIYTLARRFSLTPTSEELESGISTLVEAYLEGSDLTEKQLLRRWGTEYFEASYYYDYVMTALQKQVTISERG